MSKKTLLEKTIRQSLGGRKLILASNRGPVQFTTDEDGVGREQRGAGGLITALHSVLTATEATWVAAAMTKEDRAIAAREQMIGLPENDPLYQLYFVDIPPDVYELYYNGFSNKILWFLQHYLFDALNEPVFDESTKTAWLDGYTRVNRQFAESIAALTRDDPDPIVLIQDYHLYLTAGFLRPLKPEALLFHFIHIPWCSPDYFRFLPSGIRQGILEALLANDIIGLHSWRYVRNFMQCCRDFLGCRIDSRQHLVHVGDRAVRVKAYPISISVDELLAAGEHPDVVIEMDRFAELKKKYQLLVRIDRAELSKNLVRGFDAFDLLLERHPELRGQVKFLAYAYPTREGLAEYRAYRRTIESRVDKINSAYGANDWRPIELFIEDNYHRSVAAMRSFDVLLTNPVCDGMNLVAKEAAILNAQDGVIVLSENAGAYEELRDGVLGVNPFDIEETMRKLHQALTMTPLERGLRSDRLREIVERNDVLKWLRHQLRDVKKVSDERLMTKARMGRVFADEPAIAGPEQLR